MTDTAALDHRPLALTGATGFIGSTLLRRLSAAGHRVRALYRPYAGRALSALPGVEWMPGALGDGVALANLVRGSAAVIHCAGAVRGARRADFDRVNREGTRRLVEAAAATPGDRRFLLLSSLAAREPELSDYAGSKRRGEQALAAHAGSLRWNVLRPPAVFGPGDREMRPLFDAIAHGIAVLPAGARGRFSLLYAEDLASAVLAWLETAVESGTSFELDDGQVGGYDWDGVIAVASQVLRGGRAVRRLPLPLPLLHGVAGINLAAARVFGYAPMLTPGKVRELLHHDWVCDATALTTATGWRPAFPLARALAATFGKPVLASHGVA